MFQMALIDVMQAEREREIKSAMRRRRLLQPQEGASESLPAPVDDTSPSRQLAVRTRPTGG